jgi:PhzF family phenazine biosynthesis protein
MQLKLFQIDAFADNPFEGNPAAVMPLDAWIDDKLMQSIAMENNLAETAFFVPAPQKGEGHYDLRWFTPVVEVDLCGHATLASGHVVLNHLHPGLNHVTFHTKSGPLTVARDGGYLAMDLPASPPGRKYDKRFIKGLTEGLAVVPREVMRAIYPLAVMESEDDVLKAQSTSLLAEVLARHGETGVIVTAQADTSKEYDVASRFFVPGKGIAEDPVTGAAHTSIVPYWAKVLGRKEIVARQVSARGGTLLCTDNDDRVTMRGKCAEYMTGTVTID